MAVGQDTIFERFLAPIFQNLLIDPEAMDQFYRSIDWENTCDRLKNPNLIYPEYYQSQNFHGIEGGYLTIGAAVSYDPVTQYVLPPNETWVRQGVINAVKTQPRRILDLGCGTGSTTLLLKQAFPASVVVGLDLSPYMLAALEAKAKTAELDIQLVHANAENTGFEDASFDLVTASLLFHETPPVATQTILKESFRLLPTGGQVIIFDGNQKTLRHVEWLTQIFEEPYIQDYAAGSLDAMLGAAGFGDVRTEDWWGIHQISCGVKPLPNYPISVDDVLQTETFSGSPQWA
ncbi:MAG: methyltransferase domain-containing protein [Microcoleaceae cyanobacterium]